MTQQQNNWLYSLWHIKKRRQTRAFGIYLICRRLCHSVDIYRILINISETSSQKYTHLYTNMQKKSPKKKKKEIKAKKIPSREKKIIQPETQKHFKMCFFFQQTISAFICYNILNRNDLRLHCFGRKRDVRQKENEWKREKKHTHF